MCEFDMKNGIPFLDRDLAGFSIGSDLITVYDFFGAGPNEPYVDWAFEIDEERDADFVSARDCPLVYRGLVADRTLEEAFSVLPSACGWFFLIFTDNW